MKFHLGRVDNIIYPLSLVVKKRKLYPIDIVCMYNVF